jgi:hypothetical protein
MKELDARTGKLLSNYKKKREKEKKLLTVMTVLFLAEGSGEIS